MADTKLTDLTADELPAAADIVYIVVDPAGSPLDRKMTHDDLLFGASGTPSTQAHGDAAAKGSALDAARLDHKNAMPTGSQIATGTYTGDGEVSQAITGIGFTPKFVHIWERQTADNHQLLIKEDIYNTAEIMDDIAAFGSITHGNDGRFVDDSIIAYGSDGFTVDDNSNDEAPNKNSLAYNFMVLG